MWAKPFIKQQLDYPRHVGYERMGEFSEHVAQAIGYYARMPSDLQEWYQPLENRFYRKDQN